MAEVTPGTLRLVRGRPNPDGAEGAQLFLFVGDVTRASVREVIPDRGVQVPSSPCLPERPCRLCILHFNDLHGHLSHLSPQGSSPVFSRMVSQVRHLRRRAREDPHLAVLFLSGGDDLVGTVFDELLGSGPGSYQVHAGYHAYSAAGVDVGVLGNHDFDKGARLLAHAIQRDARFPLLSANLRAAPPLDQRAYPAALLVIKGIRVGIVGLTTPAEIRPSRDAAFEITHPLTATEHLLPALRPLCDVLLVLSHLGHSLMANSALTRDAGDVELASGLPRGSVHLIVGGHTHQATNEQGLHIANLVNGIPIVQAGAQGRFLGQADITVGRTTAVSGVRLMATADLPVDEDFERKSIQPLLDRVRPIFARHLGRVEDHADLSSEVVHNSFAASESALANFISDGLVARCLASGQAVDLAAIDASSVGCGLPVGGELTFGDWFKLMPYADTIRLCRITGRQLADLLNDNARRVDRPGEPHVERGFLHFSQQVRYTIELKDCCGTACASRITVDGVPLERQLERTFTLACTSFCRESAGPWEGYAARDLGLSLGSALGSAYTETDLYVRDLLIAYIREHGGVTEEAGARRDGRLKVIGPQGPRYETTRPLPVVDQGQETTAILEEE